MQLNEEVWIIMSKDRKIIAKGVPRNRYLCFTDKKNNKRILTYSSKGKAESGFMDNGFYYENEAENYATKKGYINERGFVNYDDFEEKRIRSCEMQFNNGNIIN